MELLPVRRKSCLLRLRLNCPLRKLRRQTYAVSAAASSAIGSIRNNVDPPASNQPLPPLSIGYEQSDTAAEVHMEDEPPAENQQNQKDPENRTGNKMELDDDDNVDPETGERRDDPTLI